MCNFARVDFPSLLYLMVEISMVGRVDPTVDRRRSYSSAIIVVQAGRSWRPTYYSSYAAFIVSKSDLDRYFILSRVGTSIR